jgi:hypothetical protein
MSILRQQNMVSAFVLCGLKSGGASLVGAGWHTKTRVFDQQSIQHGRGLDPQLSFLL